MFTGMGMEIGKDRPKMKFISSLEFNGDDFNFIEFVDHIDPVNCDKPVEERHYLLKWEGQNGNEPEECWTNCDNVNDHRSGLQEYYDDVTR